MGRMPRYELEALEREGGWAVLDLVREVRRLRGLVREAVEAGVGCWCRRGECPLKELEMEGAEIVKEDDGNRMSEEAVEVVK